MRTVSEFSGYQGLFPPVVKQPWHEADDSPAYGAKVNSKCSHILPLPHTTSWFAQGLSLTLQVQTLIHTNVLSRLCRFMGSQLNYALVPMNYAVHDSG